MNFQVYKNLKIISKIMRISNKRINHNIALILLTFINVFYLIANKYCIFNRSNLSIYLYLPVAQRKISFPLLNSKMKKYIENKVLCEYMREETKRRQTSQLASDEIKELSFRS